MVSGVLVPVSLTAVNTAWLKVELLGANSWFRYSSLGKLFTLSRLGILIYKPEVTLTPTSWGLLSRSRWIKAWKTLGSAYYCTYVRRLLRVLVFPWVLALCPWLSPRNYVKNVTAIWLDNSYVRGHLCGEPMQSSLPKMDLDRNLSLGSNVSVSKEKHFSDAAMTNPLRSALLTKWAGWQSTFS